MLKRIPTLLLFALACAVPSAAQRQQRQPLTEPQIEQIREAGIDPDLRIQLYTRFVQEHVDALAALSKRGRSDARTHKIDDTLQDLTALMDELGSNLDQYGERKADLRKSLKKLNESTSLWLDAVRALPPESGFDLARKEALESGRDLADQAAQLQKEQAAYFATHKDEKGQDRAEPED